MITTRREFTVKRRGEREGYVKVDYLGSSHVLYLGTDADKIDTTTPCSVTFEFQELEGELSDNVKCEWCQTLITKPAERVTVGYVQMHERCRDDYQCQVEQIERVNESINSPF